MAAKPLVSVVAAILWASAGAAADDATAGAPEAPRAVKDPVAGMELVPVKGGCFEMGSDGVGGPEERPAHEVCVGDFLIGRTEVTQAQWTKVMGKNPSNHAACGPDCPVEMVSWNDAQTFLAKLNKAAGKKAAGTYRLPTEAEWEYAARSGGKREKFAGESDDVNAVAWYMWSADGKPRPVATKGPNGLGLHDMTGNVWEWTADWYDEGYYASSPRKNPSGPASGTRRVLRGGSYAVDTYDCRTTYRNFLPPGHRAPGIGLRVVRTAPPGKT